MINTDRMIRDVVCPQCTKPFRLTWNDFSTEADGTYVNVPCTLSIRSCPSGGVYDVIIECPHCDYTEPL